MNKYARNSLKMCKNLQSIWKMLAEMNTFLHILFTIRCWFFLVLTYWSITWCTLIIECFYFWKYSQILIQYHWSLSKWSLVSIEIDYDTLQSFVSNWKTLFFRFYDIFSYFKIKTSFLLTFSIEDHTFAHCFNHVNFNFFTFCKKILILKNHT